MCKTLISPQQYSDDISDNSCVVLDCRFVLGKPAEGWNQYKQGHIPGARYADLEKDLSAAVESNTGRHPLPQPKKLSATFSGWGIGPGTQVVCYDDQSGAIAARAWWLLRWLGHESVAVLEGGWNRWIHDKRVVSTEIPIPARSSFEADVRHEWVVDARTLQKGLAEPSLRLLDARAANRFRGDTEPLDTVAGHVPGAVNAPFQENTNAEGVFLSPEQLRSRYLASIADFSPRQTVAMCGSGVTACHTLLAMEVAGLPGAKLYAGSWSEWIRDPRRPVVTGDN